MQDFIFVASLSMLPLVGSLLLAAKLFGRERVVRWLGASWCTLADFLENLGRRCYAAIQAFVNYGSEAGTISMDEIAEQIEDDVSRACHRRITILNNQVCTLTERVQRLEEQARIALSSFENN